MEQHEYNSERRDVNAFQGRGTYMRRHRDRTTSTVQVWVKQAHQRRGHSLQSRKQGGLAETRKVEWHIYPEGYCMAEKLEFFFLIVIEEKLYM